MAQPDPPEDHQGPYAEEDGNCLGGNPLNRFGRCEPMNTGQCAGGDPCPLTQ